MVKLNFAFIVTLLLAVMPAITFSQAFNTDSLQLVLKNQPDTVKVQTLIKTGYTYYSSEKYDTALNWYLDALKLAEKINNKQSQFIALYEVADFYQNQRKKGLALEFALRARKIAEQQRNDQNLFKALDLIGGFIYFNQGNFEQSLAYGLELQALAHKMNDKERIAYSEMYLGDVNRVLEKFDTAIALYSKAIETWRELNDTGAIRTSLNNIGVIYDAQGNYQKALEYYLSALRIAEQQRDNYMTADYSNAVARTYINLKNYNEALVYAERSLTLFRKYGKRKNIAEQYSILSDIQAEKGNYKEAYQYQTQYGRLKDSLLFGSAPKNIDSLQSSYQAERVEQQINFLKRESALQSKLRNTFIAATVLLIIIALLVTNKYRAKKKSETLLNAKNADLSQALTDLKSAQSQLIQSAKMASLGELTAGIAHEIQNPLNFVNNFSEINNELIAELKSKKSKLKTEEQDEILNDVFQNNEKITQHGKRADAIVKGMLQHSRKSTGEKELTDINALADEYLRLAYRGFWAKDKDFHVTMQTDFDSSIGKINIMPQDIGRVLLNIYNNAFYAVKPLNPLNKECNPTVTVSTKKSGDKVIITVADNGSGIPENIKDKIFQPFFTTKPTGQGTGLGLSLAYDIVKAHGGEIKVDTAESQGTIFTIQLPAG